MVCNRAGVQGARGACRVILMPGVLGQRGLALGVSVPVPRRDAAAGLFRIACRTGIPWPGQYRASAEEPGIIDHRLHIVGHDRGRAKPFDLPRVADRQSGAPSGQPHSDPGGGWSRDGDDRKDQAKTRPKHGAPRSFRLCVHLRFLNGPRTLHLGPIDRQAEHDRTSSKPSNGERQALGRITSRPK